MIMNIYDKAAWHIDAGENISEVTERFRLIFQYLSANNLLNEDGEEILEMGIDESTSLHSDLLTNDGKNFLDEYYEKMSFLSYDELAECLTEPM